MNAVQGTLHRPKDDVGKHLGQYSTYLGREQVQGSSGSHPARGLPGRNPRTV